MKNRPNNWLNRVKFASNHTIFSFYILHSSIFCVPLHPLFEQVEHWRDGRVVDYNGLENRRTERYRGFESLSLRQKHLKGINQVPFFYACLSTLFGSNSLKIIFLEGCFLFESCVCSYMITQ